MAFAHVAVLDPDRPPVGAREQRRRVGQRDTAQAGVLQAAAAFLAVGGDLVERRARAAGPAGTQVEVRVQIQHQHGIVAARLQPARQALEAAPSDLMAAAQHQRAGALPQQRGHALAQRPAPLPARRPRRPRRRRPAAASGPWPAGRPGTCGCRPGRRAHAALVTGHAGVAGEAQQYALARRPGRRRRAMCARRRVSPRSALSSRATQTLASSWACSCLLSLAVVQHGLQAQVRASRGW